MNTIPKPVGNLTITKELFIETINQIEKQHKHDSKCSEAFRVILPDDYISCYNNEPLRSQLLKLVKLAMNDEQTGWIEYFIWELDFGKDYKEGMVQMEGENITLKTPSDLWEFLQM
ncbi:hypothetical protein [Roseivirga spongicola]|uniref:hypothetical protein n=1 Tax=Roseivirga spongicola TaxID=333140 RepID=UPI002AC8FB0F|nr:hypothetical protein [Roseivirga spongicola]WPZ08764.1 hypothetical protein T7867_10895 [Roseivirga spongicola]